MSPNPPVPPPLERRLPAEAESLAHTRYIRRYSHDVGNCLTAIDLQTMVLQRSLNTPGESNDLAIIRRQIGCIAEMQLRLELRFRAPIFTEIPLSSAVKQCRSRQRIGSAHRAIDWSFDGAECYFHADTQAASVIIVEIADHWFANAGGAIKAYACGGKVCFQMRRADAEDPEDSQPGLPAEVGDELSSLVSRFGGTLRCGTQVPELEVTFPAAPVAATQP